MSQLKVNVYKYTTFERDYNTWIWLSCSKSCKCSLLKQFLVYGLCVLCYQMVLCCITLP